MVSLAYKENTWIVKKFYGEKVVWTVYAKGLKDAMGIVREIKKEEFPQRRTLPQAKTHANKN